MVERRDTKTQKIIETATNLASKKRLKLAAQLMFIAGISESIIERVLYEPHNIRESDLINNE